MFQLAEMSGRLALTNEADVREDFITPFLAELGYRKGTENDILREKNLIYQRNFLGRKKSSDPPLAGRADYILSVVGAGRWVIEAKPPSVAISRDDIEQALTYARHPEISAALCVITNGAETRIYNSMASFEDGAVGIATESDPYELARKLQPIIGPQEFRAKFCPKNIRLSGGVATGFSESCEIVSGTATYRGFEWDSNISSIPEVSAKLNVLKDSMKGFVSHISEGSVSVDGDRIVVRTSWSMLNDKMEAFANTSGFSRIIEFYSFDPVISSDPEIPTYFDSIMEFSVKPGDQMYESPFDSGSISELNMKSRVTARAKGHVQGEHFVGEFFMKYYYDFPDYPQLEMSAEGFGDFSMRLGH